MKTENSNLPTAMLIDTMSIQQYVFSSNKMRINLGASLIVSTFFETICTKLLGDSFTTANKNWNDTFQDSKLTCNNFPVKFYIGYIGGGNALLFFENKDQAEYFIQCFSFELLNEFPGLIINYGIYENFGQKTYSEDIKCLFKNLNENKNRLIPITQSFKLPIATISDFDSNAPVAYNSETKAWMSEASNIKNQENGEAVTAFNEKYLNGTKYEFPLELEDVCLGDQRGHIAVIHIDGNGFGKLFQSIDSLENARKLSKAVDVLSNTAYKQLIKKTLIPLINKDGNILDYTLTKKGSNTLLPIRPIIIGGDDICFICDGKLGIYLAEKFIEYFTSDENLKAIKDIKRDAHITACAGIAIIKRKYPFPKAYQLAEELCQSAKKKAKEQETVCSALDYHIANTGFAGSWEDIQNSYYHQDIRNLHFGPYLFKEGDNKSLSILKNAAVHYQTKWSNTKLAQLKRVLWETPVQQQIFLDESKLKDGKQELFDNKNEATKSEKEKSIEIAEYDRIELTDFYPLALLNTTTKSEQL